MSQEEEEVTLDINLKILGNSEVVTIPLPNNITMESIKILASDYTDIPIDKMRLILTGRAMRNGTTLKDYDVHNGSTIHIVPERERNQRPQPQRQPPSNIQQPSPAQVQEQQNQQNQEQQPNQQNERNQENVQPTFPAPNSDLVQLRTAVSNVQQYLSEISFAASTLQRAVNQPSVGTSNEALANLCQRVNDVIPQILQLNSDIYTYHAFNVDGDGNRIAFSRDGPMGDPSSDFNDGFSFGFNSALNHLIQSAPNTIVLEPQNNDVNSNSQPLVPPSAQPTSNSNQNSSTVSTTTTSSTGVTTSTTTTTTYTTAFSMNQPPNVQPPTNSVSGSFQGEIAPGVQAAVDVQVIDVPDDNNNDNGDGIVEVNNISIDIDSQVDPAGTPESTEASNSGTTTSTTGSVTTDSPSPAAGNQNGQQQPSSPPNDDPVDLSQIVLDPEELEIVNADAAVLRDHFEPPILGMQYFRQSSNNM